MEKKGKVLEKKGKVLEKKGRRQKAGQEAEKGRHFQGEG